MSPMAKIFLCPLILKFSSTISWPLLSKHSLKMESRIHDEPNGLPTQTKWLSAVIFSPPDVVKTLLSSEVQFTLMDWPKRTSTFFDVNQSSALFEAFWPMNSSNLDPLWTKVTFFSGQSTAISPANSTPVGPPPTIKIEREDFIFWLSE